MKDFITMFILMFILPVGSFAYVLFNGYPNNLITYIICGITLLIGITVIGKVNYYDKKD